jgi:translation initiation factor IF-1
MSRLIHAMAVAGVFVAAHPVFSQETNPNQNQNNPPAATSLRGKVVRVEGQDRIVLQTNDNREIILLANPNTRYVIDGRAGRLTDLRAGVIVSADYTLDSGRYMVSAVQVGAPAVPAQPGGVLPPVAETTLRGTVVRVEGQDRVVVKTSDNREIILISNPNTSYIVDGKAGRFTDLRTGATVSAAYTVNDGRYMVSSIQVGDFAPAQPGINPPAVGTNLRGTVVRVEGQDRIVVKTTDNREIILVSNPTTRYIVAGKAARFTDLRTGATISAAYTVDNGRYIVSSVQVGEAVAVAPQQPPAGINERRFRGRVVSVNATTNQIVAKSEDGTQVTLFVQKTGRFLRNGQPIRMADLQVGAIVEAQYIEQGGHWWVDEVTIITDNAAQEPLPAGTTQVQGVVVRVIGQNQVVIKTTDNKELIVDLTPQTVYTFNNQAGQFRDIQAGQDLRIQYTTRDRRPIASRIFGNRRN